METPLPPAKKRVNIPLVIGIALGVAFLCGCVILVVMVATGMLALNWSA